MVALIGTSRMWDTGAGSIAWIALISAACFGVYHVYRSAREY
jgi:EamA domain-containing membrane protein RarD